MVINGCLWFYFCELILNSGIKYLRKIGIYSNIRKRERERENWYVYIMFCKEKWREYRVYIFIKIFVIRNV